MNTTIAVPNKKLAPLVVAEGSKIASDIKYLKNSEIYPIVEKCATNSNLPKELIYSLIYVLSNGQNNKEYKSNDNPKLTRQGYFALSQKIAKIILINELSAKRMNKAERDFLYEHGNDALRNYIAEEKGKKSFNEYWSVDMNVGTERISDSANPFNLSKPEVSIALGTLWAGQVWDKYAEQTTSPADKVIITMLLPYNGWLGGNDFCKAKSWKIDYTDLKNFDKLPRPATDTAPTNVINPKGGYIGKSLATVLAKGGAMDTLLNG